MKSYLLSEAKKNAEKFLIASGYENCDRFIEPILSCVVKNQNINLTEKQYKAFKKLIERKANGEPLESILGTSEFLDCVFKYSDNVLTPRQETEILADIIDRQNENNLKLLDLCSGSGCIGISLAKKKHYDVTLADVSKKAIKNSKINAKLNGVNVNAICSNLFDKINGKFDLIVSNPPYIKTGDLEKLEKEVKLHDPIIALDGGEDGLKFYREIISKAQDYLLKNGKLYLEIDDGLENEIMDLFRSYNYKDIVIEKDFSGKYRFAYATKGE